MCSLIFRVANAHGVCFCLSLQRPTGAEGGPNQGEGGQLLPEQDEGLPGEAAESPPGRQNRTRTAEGVRNAAVACRPARELNQIK